MERQKAKHYKFGSDCTGTLTFVEKLFPLVTSQIYPCKNGRIFVMWKRYSPYQGTYLNHDIITLGKKPLQESAVNFIVTTLLYFINLYLEKNFY